MEIDIEKLKQELKEEIMKEFKMKDEVFVKRQINSSPIRKKYHQEICEKFGVSGTIEDAIRYVTIYSMGYRKMSSIPYSKQKEFNEKMEKIYKFILEDLKHGN